MAVNIELYKVTEAIRKLKGVGYDFKMGPDQVRNEGVINYLNCQAYIHELFKDLGFNLPLWMKSKEIYEDTSYFRFLNPKEVYKPLDIFLFGKVGERDHRKLHLAAFTGKKNPHNGSPLLSHANCVDQKVTEWPLESFFAYPQYGNLYAVKRHRELD